MGHTGSQGKTERKRARERERAREPKKYEHLRYSLKPVWMGWVG
jgi:hypothetical protein